MRDPHIDKLIQDLKTKKFQEGEGKRLTDSFGENMKTQFGPSIDGMGKEVVKAIKESLSGLKMPDMPKMPEYTQQEIPQPVVNVEAPIVNIPAPVVHVPAPIVNIPATQFPDYPEFPSEMSLKAGAKPFPVIMSDAAGKPINWGALGGGTSGGRGDFYTIKDIQNSSGGSLIDSDGFFKVTGAFSVSSSNSSTQVIDSSNNPFGTAANPINVAITSGAASSTKSQIGNSDGDFTQANPLPVVFSSSASTASALIDSSGVQYSGSNPLPVTFTGSSSTSVTLVNADGAKYDSSQGLPVTLQTALDATIDSISTYQASGANFSVSVTGASGTIGASMVDSSGIQYSGSNPLPVTFAAAGFQNVATYDAAQSAITSHLHPVQRDFRGLDSSIIQVVNVESALNSSASVLGIGGEFTGLPEDVMGYAAIQVSVISDVASSTNGLSIQQSSDGSNWDILDTYTIPAASGKTFSFQPVARYFRIFYANGGTGQGSFRMYTAHHYLPLKASSQRSQDAYTNETDLEQMWAFNSGYNSTTDQWDRIRIGDGTAAGALRVTFAADAVASVNLISDLSDSLQVIQTSGAADSVFVIGPIAQGDSTSAVRVIQAGDSVSSTVINSGTLTTVSTVTAVTSVTNSIAAMNVDSSGVGYSGSNPFPITVVTNATSSLNVALTDSGGIQYSGSNPVPITVISGALTSTLSVGDSAARSADNGGNPVKVGGIARTTNPTAFADGDRSNFSSDKLGRQVVRTVQVRDLIATAYVALTTGTEATLLAAGAGTFLDLIMLTATNNSTAATQLDIRNTSAGNIIHTMYLPASTGPIGFAPTVPWPQDATGNSWTIDMPDQTGTTVYVSALFSKEV